MDAMFLARPAVIFVVLTSYLACGKIYQRCELARELRNFDVPENEISTWVCIAKYESLFDTAAMNPGSGDHGLFQISQLYWCSPPRQGYGCNSPCSKFRDDDISDDLQCIRRIHNEHKRISGDGFTAWVVYPLYCKEDTSSYIADCFDEEFIIGSIQSGNVTENEISTSEESGEYGDGYEFPSLPKFPKKDKVVEDGYEFPELPKMVINSSRNVGRLLPFNKASIHNFVFVDRGQPYSKVSISHFIPVKPANNEKNPSHNFPFSKKSIHHFVSVKGNPTTNEEVLSRSEVLLSETTPKIDDLQMSSSTLASATFKPLPTFKPLQPLTLERSTTIAHLSNSQLNALTRMLSTDQVLEEISLTEILPKNIDLETSTFTSVPSTLKPLSTFKPLQFLTTHATTMKTPLIFQRSGLELTTTRPYETTLTTIKPLPTFKPLRNAPATFKPLSTFKPLQPLTLERNATKAPLSLNKLNVLTKMLPTSQALEKIGSTKILPKNIDLQVFTSVPSVLKPLPTFKTVKFLSTDPTTTKAPLISQRPYETTLTTIKPLPTFKPLQNPPASLKPLPTFKPLQPLTLERSTTRAPLNHSKLKVLTKMLPTSQALEEIGSTQILPKNIDLQVFTSVPSTLKPLPTFKPWKFLSTYTTTTMAPLISQRSGLELTTRPYETTLTTIKPLPTFKPFRNFTFESTTKKSPLIFQRSEFEHVTIKALEPISITPLKPSQEIANKPSPYAHRHLRFYHSVEATVSPKSATLKSFPTKKSNQFTTIKPSARQVTFAPDSWFSWIFNSQTLPPILPPPPRPPSMNPDRPRPGGFPSPTSTPLERPPAPPRPLRPSAQGSLQRPAGPGRPGMEGFTTRRPFPLRPSNQNSSQRPLGPNRRPEIESGFTTRRPFTLRPIAHQPSRFQPVLGQTVMQPIELHRSARPILNPVKNYDPLEKMNNDDSKETEKQKDLEGAEIMLDNHSVFVRTRYGFRLFHTK